MPFPRWSGASIRIIIATVFMFAFAFVTRRPHPQGGATFFGPLVIFALLGVIINQGSFLVGLHYTTSTNAAILNTMIPVFTLLIVTLRGQEKATFKRILGFLSAFAGVLILRRIEDFTLSDETLIGDLFMLVNCFSFALFLTYSKNFVMKHDRVWTTAWMFLYGSVGLSLVATPDYLTFQMPEMTTVLWSSAAFAVIGGTLLTYFLNNWTLAHAESSHVALFIYIQPVIASVLAWAYMDVPITLRMVLSSLLIFAGVLLVYSRPKKLKVPLAEMVTEEAVEES
jgi:drug/metabolite transporter (DMT)-like permease